MCRRMVTDAQMPLHKHYESKWARIREMYMPENIASSITKNRERRTLVLLSIETKTQSKWGEEDIDHESQKVKAIRKRGSRRPRERSGTW